MSEERYEPAVVGTEVMIQDLQNMTRNAAYADDRILWEFLRLKTGSVTPDRAIIPYGKRDSRAESGLTSTALVHGNVADGKVRVMPFRAIIGPSVTTPQISKLREQKSGYLVGASAQETLVPITTNNLGLARWTLIYATVTPDADGASATYVRKDPATSLVSPFTAVVTKKTTVTVTALNGDDEAPARPAVPADPVGGYNIALAYIFLPAGFQGATEVTPGTIDRGVIHEVAPVYSIHSAMGVASMVPANQQHKVGGTVDVRQVGVSSATFRPGAYIPSTMVGSESIIVLLQRGVTPVSHNDGDVVDDSRDWRYRYFEAMVHGRSGTNPNTSFASDRNTPNPPTPAGSGQSPAALVAGQSFTNDDAGLAVPFGVADSLGAAVYVDSNTVSFLGVGNAFVIYVRDTDGALIFKQDGADTFQARIRITATAPYSNFAQV